MDADCILDSEIVILSPQLAQLIEEVTVIGLPVACIVDVMAAALAAPEFFEDGRSFVIVASPHIFK